MMTPDEMRERADPPGDDEEYIVHETWCALAELASRLDKIIEVQKEANRLLELISHGRQAPHEMSKEESAKYTKCRCCGWESIGLCCPNCGQCAKEPRDE